MNSMIAVENGNVLEALRGFFRNLLESGAVEALFIPLETGKGTVIPALVVDPAQLQHANPLAPVMPINNARAVSALTGKTPPARLGVVLRSCEMRALIELVKLQQASLQGVTMIGLDCPGTYAMAEFVARKKRKDFALAGYLVAATAGQDPALDDLALRPACQMCIQPMPAQAAIKLHLFGVDVNAGIPVEMDDDIAVRMQISAGGEWDVVKHQTVVDQVVARHKQVRDKELGAIRLSMNSNGGIAGQFETCIRCHNCMTACPICYCKTCLFKTAAFDHQPEHYLTAAKRKGAVRLPGDTMLFHMTRLNHMSVSCVSCGMCTSACPSDIPVGAIFSAIGEQVQMAFEYAPGRSLEESLPLITFQANEWLEVGEAK